MTGHNPWDTIRDALSVAADFAQGVGAQVGYNNTSMVIPSERNVYTPQADESTAMSVGQHVGNVVSGVQGVVEVVGGVGGMMGGAAACGTAVLCVAGAPAIAGGAAMTAHGSAVGINAALQEGQMLANLMMSVATGNGSSVPTLRISNAQFGKKVGEHAKDYGLDPSKPDDRNWLRSHIEDIASNYDEVRQGAWRGGCKDCIFFRQGEDVVVAKADGEFVTILKGGHTNGWFSGATPLQ